MLTGKWVYKRFREGSTINGFLCRTWAELDHNSRDDWEYVAMNLTSLMRVYTRTEFVRDVAGRFSGTARWSNLSRKEKALWKREAAALRREIGDVDR